jgi:uncharacterized membrane protein YcaP (DUF421 family)
MEAGYTIVHVVERLHIGIRRVTNGQAAFTPRVCRHHDGRRKNPFMDGTFQLGDIHRLLFGESSPAYLAEVFLRAALTYAGVVAVMRLLGARVVGQFTLLEMSVTVVVAAAIGVPLLSADRGLLPALLLVAALVAIQRGIAAVGFRRRRFQTLISSDMCVVVRDGALDLRAMERNAISRETVFSQLRMAGHLNLGEVARVYIEPSGNFTVVADDTPRPGLSMVPARDEAMARLMRASADVCAACGGALAAGDGACGRCGSHERRQGVVVPEDEA